ncbi:MAG: PIG-L deacetylase family protein [Alphaproteobacteria bacterium]
MPVSNAIAAIYAHPDDEVLACGGALARHADAGDLVNVLILATGVTARGKDAAAGIEALRGQARAAARVLGVAEVSFGDFPDNGMDSIPLLNVVRRVEAFLTEHPATTVYTHHLGDLNLDHRIVAQAVLTACRPLPGAKIGTVLAGEVLSSSEWGPPGERFVPDTHLEITRQLERKRAALSCYTAELRDFPHPRSMRALESLAHLRGSEAGVTAAEAFITLRRVLRDRD